MLPNDEDKLYHYAKYTMQFCDALREDPTLLDGFSFDDSTLNAPFKAVFTAYYYSYEIGGETIKEFKDFITNRFKVAKSYYEELIKAYNTKIDMLDGKKTTTSRELRQTVVNSGSDSNSNSNEYYELPRSTASEDKPTTKSKSVNQTDYGKTSTTTKDYDNLTIKGGINVIELKKGYLDMLRNIQEEFCRKEFMSCFITMYN